MVKLEQHCIFPPFRLDSVNEQLWCGTHLLPLRPKTFAVLYHLVAHAGALVTREELLKAVWPDTHGAEGLPKKSIHELRKVLGDDAATPQFIETVARRRGWRFIAPLATSPQSVSSSKFQVASKLPPTPDTQHSLPYHLVGREVELAQLHQWLKKALSRERRVVFVTGEPGIGKTAVVDAFLAQVAGNGDWWIARGQCVEQHGVGEAYLPVLEALGRLCRAAGGEQIIRLLHRQAPTWLVQMPALIEDLELEALQRKALGTAQERMLREIAEALEALTVERPLVLWLEDLQWSDYSTLDLIHYLAQRRGPARLLLIGTYRHAEVIISGHPLKAIKQELQAHGQCAELPLRFLSEKDVTEYLAWWFAAPSPTSGVEGWDEGLSPAPSFRKLARIIHQSTEGNPLFMVTMVDYLVDQGVIAEEAGQWQVQARPEDIAVGVPDSLRQLIEKQLERLAKDEQQVLAVASVVGVEFSAAAVAAGLEEQLERVEEWCEGLAHRGHFLAARGTERLPDERVAERYGFLHALYQKVLYERLAAARRTRLHQRIGEGGEAAYGARVGEIAAELATHFERGQDYWRAIHYLGQAAQNALQRSANREAINLLSRELALLQTLPITSQRNQQELFVQIALAVPLMMTKGYTAPEVRAAYARARELARETEESPQLFPLLYGLSRFSYGRNASQSANKLREQMLRLAHRTQESSPLLVAHMNLGGNWFFQGEFSQAHSHAQQGLSLYDPRQHRTLIFLYGDDPQVLCLCWAALALWYLGYPAQALDKIYQALRTAQELAHPFGLAFALFWTAFLHQARGEVQSVQEQTEALMVLTQEHEIPQFSAMGAILHGWALTEQGHEEEGIAQLQRSLADLRATRQELGRPYFLALLAEAYSKRGRGEEGLAVLTEALEITRNTGECMHQAELYRLKGTRTLQSKVQSLKSKVEERPESEVRGPASEAEEDFWKAIEIARKQQARSLELRATMDLVRLWRQQQGKKAKARQMLAEIYGWFTEGFDTLDLQEAKAMLEDMA